MSWGEPAFERAANPAIVATIFDGRWRLKEVSRNPAFWVHVHWWQ